MTVSQFRIARPTDQLDAVVRFYRDGLGFTVIGEFRDHDGYDGVMLALPGRGDHLEFTAHRAGGPCPAPTRDNLLVLYLPQPLDFAALAERLRSHGHAPVEPENPYWTQRKALTFADPDGWRVVLFPGPGLRVDPKLAEIDGAGVAAGVRGDPPQLGVYAAEHRAARR